MEDRIVSWRYRVGLVTSSEISRSSWTWWQVNIDQKSLVLTAEKSRLLLILLSQWHCLSLKKLSIQYLFTVFLRICIKKQKVIIWLMKKTQPKVGFSLPPKLLECRLTNLVCILSHRIKGSIRLADNLSLRFYIKFNLKTKTYF